MALPIPQKRMVGAAGSSLGLSGLIGGGSANADPILATALLEAFDVHSTSYPITAMAIHNGNLITCGDYSTVKNIKYHDGMTSTVLNTISGTDNADDACVIGDELFVHEDASTIRVYTIANNTLTYLRGIPRPTTYTKGLTTDGTDLYTWDYAGGVYENATLVRFSPTTGAILEQTPFYLSNSSLEGLAWADGNLITVGGNASLGGGFAQMREGITNVILSRIYGLEDSEGANVVAGVLNPESGDFYLAHASRSNYSYVSRRYGFAGARDVTAQAYYAPAGAKKNWRALFANSANASVGISRLEFRESIGGPSLTTFENAPARANASSANGTSRVASAYSDGSNNVAWMAGAGAPVSEWVSWRFDNPVLINEVQYRNGPSVALSPDYLTVQSSSDNGVTWQDEWHYNGMSLPAYAVNVSARP